MARRSTGKGLSRRSVIGGVGAATLMVESIGPLAQPLAPDPAPTIEDLWFALGRAEKYLSHRGGDIESWLMENFGWAELSEDEQKALPEAQELYEIDGQFAELEKQRRSIQEQLLSAPSTTLEGTILKLKVAADTITTIDNRTAHHLIAAAIDELTALAAYEKSS